MADKNTLLILRLEGALQSWGENSKWDFRDSSTMPTKSGIVGLLGCALGLERNSSELIDLAGSISIAVRADRPGVKFIDFQTVTGDPLMAATGKPKTKMTGNTILSPHAYLQDACFTVFIDTTDYWREQIIKALQNPKWCMYLGRKNCVPSRPVFECISNKYSTLLEAVAEYPFANRAEYPLVYECEKLNSTASSLLRPDNLVGLDRQFALRQVWRGTVKEESNVSD